MVGVDISAVAFDLGGVLIRWSPEEFVNEIFSDIDPKPYEIVEMTKGEVWRNLDRGEITLEEGLELLYQEYNKDLIDRFFRELPRCLTPIDAGVEILKKVHKKGIKCYVLSNYHVHFYEQVSSLYDFFNLFEGAIVSSHVKDCKPSSSIYLKLLKEFDIKPNECIFIDDMRANIQAAKEVGIHGLQCLDHGVLENEMKLMNVI